MLVAKVQEFNVEEKCMFGILDDIIDIITSPLDDVIDILNGLSEGELREKAILRLGIDAIVGLGTTEIIELLAQSIVDEED